MTTPATKIDLNALFEVTPERFHRVNVAHLPGTGLQILYLTLAPGQAVPRHNHPGRHVLLQGLAGVATVDFGSGTSDLHAGQLLHFPGEQPVSPRNDGNEPCALLITLIKVA